MIVEISKLQLNPIHQEIYQINDLNDLVESIKESGQLVPIIVNEQFIIISGVRRYFALKQLNINEVNVEVKKFDEKDELLILISYNKQRIKTNRELLNEAKYLKEIWGQRRGRKSHDELLENEEISEPVDTRKKISEILNISAGNLSKLEYIEKQRPELIKAIDNGDITINQAHNALKKFNSEQEVINFQSALPITITDVNYTIYNKSSDNLIDLEDESIQTIFTSPPYWNKRTYSDSADELGAEKTSEEYVQRMANHLHQCHKVLKETGSFFLNLGDTYQDKCLLSIPHRIVIELVKKGWILRNTIIWKKKNHLPSTSKDNLALSYEYIFHLVKSPKYYYNQILIPIKEIGTTVSNISPKELNNKFSIHSACINGLKNGKSIEDFWTNDIVTTAICSQNVVKRYGGSEHPAPFPPEIVALPILQTSRPGDIVMDVFSGTATVGEVALLLGRKYVGYELNPNFNEVQTARLNDAIDIYNEANELIKEAA